MSLALENIDPTRIIGSSGNLAKVLRGDGTWVAPGVDVPAATATTLGTVIAGAGLNVSNGTISVAAVQDIVDVHDNKAILVHSDRSRVYYTGVGTQSGLIVNSVSQGPNSDDGVTRALKDAVDGDFVLVTTPLTMPFLENTAAIVRVKAGTTLDLNGYTVNTLFSQDCISMITTGTYFIYGRGARMKSNGAGSIALYAGGSVNATATISDLHLENRGSANGVYIAGTNGSTIKHIGSAYVENLGTWNSFNNGFNIGGTATYDFVGDIRIKGRSSGIQLYGASKMSARNGRIVLTDTTLNYLGTMNQTAVLEFVLYVIDLSANPTGGFVFNNNTATIILTDVSVLGGGLVSNSNTGTIILRGTTTLPSGYDVDYIQALGMTVLDQRGFAADVGTDVYSVSAAIRTTVVNGTYDAYHEITTTVADSLVGMRFTYKSYTYEYMPGTNGTLKWMRMSKRAPQPAPVVSIATTTSPGIVMVGSGLSIAGSTLSVDDAAFEDIYLVPQNVREAVVMGTYSTTNSELTTVLPANLLAASLPGMRFSYLTFSYEYMPGDSGSLAWIRNGKKAGGGTQNALTPSSTTLAPSVDVINNAFGPLNNDWSKHYEVVMTLNLTIQTAPMFNKRYVVSGNNIVVNGFPRGAAPAPDPGAYLTIRAGNATTTAPSTISFLDGDGIPVSIMPFNAYDVTLHRHESITIRATATGNRLELVQWIRNPRVTQWEVNRRYYKDQFLYTSGNKHFRVLNDIASAGTVEPTATDANYFEIGVAQSQVQNSMVASTTLAPSVNAVTGLTGLLASLTTTVKTSLVNAINETMSYITFLQGAVGKIIGFNNVYSGSGMTIAGSYNSANGSNSVVLGGTDSSAQATSSIIGISFNSSNSSVYTAAFGFSSPTFISSGLAHGIIAPNFTVYKNRKTWDGQTVLQNVAATTITVSEFGSLTLGSSGESATMRYRGAYIHPSIYAIGDLVNVAGKIYVSHTNLMTPSVTFDPALWTLFAIVPEAHVAATRSADYTLQINDAGKLVPFTTGSICTIPTNASAAFSIGTIIEVCQEGTSHVNITAAAGVVVYTESGNLTKQQWSTVTLRKRGTDEWVISNGYMLPL